MLLPISQALASEQRVEAITDKIYNSLKAENFKPVQDTLQKHITANTKTRHGTDMTLEILDLLIKKIIAEGNFKAWDSKSNKWNRQNPDSFIAAFFAHRLEHEQAWYYKQSNKWDELLQSVRRSHKKNLDNGYNNAFKITEKHPNEWRVHAHLAANHQRYKLNIDEINDSLFAIQKLNKTEALSKAGYITAISPSKMGRDDEMIAAGIQNVIKRHPDRNLSKPEYIDAATKQEIEDEIFELAIGRMLLTARQYIEEGEKGSNINILTPVAYKAIFEEIEKHYEGREDKSNQHPLSYKRKAVWNEITQNYNALFKNFPDSGRHLTSYLELAINTQRHDIIEETITKIEKNDPDYNPKHLSPIRCKYYSSLRGEQRTQEADEKMYNACKKASQYSPDELYFYRTGWAARKIGNFEESNQFLEKALKAKPKNDAYMTDICWNHKDLKRYDKALDYCDRAITLNRKNARAWLGRSHIYHHGFKNTAQAQKDAAMYEQLTKGQ